MPVLNQLLARLDPLHALDRARLVRVAAYVRKVRTRSTDFPRQLPHLRVSPIGALDGGDERRPIEPIGHVPPVPLLSRAATHRRVQLLDLIEKRALLNPEERVHPPLHRHRARLRRERVVAPRRDFPQRGRHVLVALVEPVREPQVHEHVLVPAEHQRRVRHALQAHVKIVVAILGVAVEKSADAAVDDRVPGEHRLDPVRG